MWEATQALDQSSFSDLELQWDRRTALGVVLAAQGYPLSPRKGDAITIAAEANADICVFHAATALRDGVLETSGGRVLCVTALADTVKAAQLHAHEAIKGIHFDGMQFRSDIGHRALKG